MQRVKELFDLAGIVSEVSADMVRRLWWKFMINVGINQASAILRGSYGLFQTSPPARALMDAAMREVIELSRKAGVPLTEADLGRMHEVLETLNPDGKTSMLQDVEARQKTEVEMFAGKVVELGRRFGVGSPRDRRPKPLPGIGCRPSGSIRFPGVEGYFHFLTIFSRSSGRA